MQKELTIIIVTYNSKEVIPKCLEGISSADFNIIIVDNASSDGTADLLEKNYPQIALIRSDKNIGFGRGCNLGLKIAPTKYCLLLNPDVITTTGAIHELLQKYKEYGKPAILGPRTRTGEYTAHQAFEKQDWVSGAVMLFEKEMLDKIGYFDENIFLFSEEVDLCKRAFDAGYDVILCNDVYMEHLVGKSSGFNPRINYLKYWHMGWSRFYYDFKHDSLVTFLSKAVAALIKYQMKLLLNTVSGNKHKMVKYKGLLAGSINFLLHRKAFDGNGNPRGI